LSKSGNFLILQKLDDHLVFQLGTTIGQRPPSGPPRRRVIKKDIKPMEEEIDLQ
jgi:hypothetical protein